MDFNKIKQQLQFDKVLSGLKPFIKAEENKEKIDTLVPFQNIYEANEELNEVRCWSKLYKNQRLPDIDIKDLTTLFSTLKKGGSFLQPAEFLNLAHFLHLSGIFKQLIENLDEEYGLLIIKYNNKIFQFKYIENLIKNTFDETGDFYDNASPELKSIRSKLRDTRNQIISKLNEFLFSGYATEIIQETIITIRNNRHVIPLKPNFSQKVKGIIQDYSSSGQTLFVEPDFIVQLNNKLSYLKQEEYYEKIKILTELSDILRDNFYELSETYKTLLSIDFKIAKAKFGLKYNFEIINLNNEEFNVFNAKNPILLINDKPVVPIDITFGDKKILIISGANTGGKTVALKTAGIISIMCRMGLPVPVDKKSQIKFFPKIFIDIGDSQNISEDLSTFSAHINNINSFLLTCNKDTLILIDELGTGTDPRDGAAIGRALIEFFLKKEPFVMLTTHIEDLKYLNYIYDKVENVSVNFDEETIKPKYNLIYGISGRSYAIKIAEKLNFNRDVTELSKKFYNQSVSDFLKKVIDIEKLKTDLFQKEKDLMMEKQNLRIEREKYRKWKEKLINEKEKIKDLIKEKYKKKYNRLTEKLNDTLEQMKKELTAKEYANLISNIKNVKEEVKKEFNVDKEKRVERSTYSLSDFFPGIRIKHLKTGVKGRVLTVDLINRKLELILDNNLKITVPYKEVIPVQDNPEKSYEVFVNNTANTLFKVNLIGKRVDDAINELEKYIDYAILKNADKIEIIHGLGTGKLKKGITDFLKSSDYIAEYYSPVEQSGGLGITIAILK